MAVKVEKRMNKSVRAHNQHVLPGGYSHSGGNQLRFFMALAALLAGVAFTLAACGDDGNVASGGGGADTTAPTASVTPGTGKLLGDAAAVVIGFSESMDTASLTLGGGLNAESDGGAWSAGNATLTISPTATWTTGAGKTLSVDAKDPAGNALATLSLAYDVVAGTWHYVSAAGDDANDGLSAVTPKQTITAAIASATSPATVLVAGGAYSVDSGAATNIVLVEGVSLYGGFNADFSARDPAANASIITDTSARVTGNLFDPNRVVEAGTDITVATIVDGFTFNGSSDASADFTTAFFVNGNAAPTIQNNILNAGSGTADSLGLGLFGTATPVIDNNTLDGGTGGLNSEGIYNESTANPVISNNTINGGLGNNSAGIFNDAVGASPTISGNTIHGGGTDGATMNSDGIYNGAGATPTISGNVIHGGEGTSNSYGIDNDGGVPSTIDNNTINGGGANGLTGTSMGIYNFASSPPITNNTLINGGEGINRSYGIFNTSGASPTISGNTLINGGGGAGGTTNSYGINNVLSGTWPTIENNVAIHGGYGNNVSMGITQSSSANANISGNNINGGSSPNWTRGIYITSAVGDAFNNTINGGSGVNKSYGIGFAGTGRGDIANNTIFPGTAGANAFGIEHNSTSTSAYIANNIIFTPGSSGGTCIKELGASNDPGTFANNNLFCNTALYVDEGATSITDLTTAVDNTGASDGTGTLAARGNVSEPPLLFDVDGADNKILTMADNDWHLTPSSPLDTREGGLDLSGSFFTLDKDLVTRTAGATSASNVGAAGWSMGAYEQD